METSNTTVQASRIACQGCANTARVAVRKVPGVFDASVDLAAQTVTVRHGPDTPQQALAEALTKAGFPAN